MKYVHSYVCTNVVSYFGNDHLRHILFMLTLDLPFRWITIISDIVVIINKQVKNTSAGMSADLSSTG